MRGYAKYFNNNDKCINSVVHNKKLIKAYNAILNRVSSLMKKWFDCKPVYNNKYLKNKINLYNGKTSKNFQGEKKTRRKCALYLFSCVLWDSVVREGKKYYLQTLLEECKYAVKIILMKN